MKKLTTALAAAALIAAPLAAAAPASASTDKVGICHATGSGKYIAQDVPKDGAANGHADHQNGTDIIPAYSWVDKKTRYYFDGQNLDKLSMLANGCKAPADQLVAAPNAPVYVPASCSRPTLPYGEVIIPKDLGTGVAGASSAFSPDSPTWSAAYALTGPTEDKVYSWPAGVTGNYSGPIVPITADPMWVTDSKAGKGQCEMPETGAADMLPWAAGGAVLLAAGVLMTRRRRTA